MPLVTYISKIMSRGHDSVSQRTECAQGVYLPDVFGLRAVGEGCEAVGSRHSSQNSKTSKEHLDSGILVKMIFKTKRFSRTCRKASRSGFIRRAA